MNKGIDSILELLSCPDDGAQLSYRDGGLCCHDCRRLFPILGDNLIELLPKHPLSLPSSVSDEYRRSYLQLFREPLRIKDQALAWGAEEQTLPSWVVKRRRQVRAVDSLIADATPTESVLCDLAAGAGYYTLSCRSHFCWVLHCDLCSANLNYCRAKAQASNCDNVLFLRIDYFRTPFRNSLDWVICLDTAIRGEDHDRLLLNSIIRGIRPNGKAIVDFHNWWHNPFRRIGLLSENFTSNKSYSRQAAESLLREAGVKRFAYRPFHQEFDPDGIFASLCKHLIPPTRLMYSLENGDQKLM